MPNKVANVESQNQLLMVLRDWLPNGMRSIPRQHYVSISNVCRNKSVN